MTSSSTTNTSGDGTRPSTDGGVDNMGGASSFTPHQKKNPDIPAAAGDSNSPQPTEKMVEKRQEGSDDNASNPGPRKDGE